MSRPNPMALVAGFFSVVPMPAFTEITKADARATMRWFAPLGLLLGLAAGLVGGLTAWLSGTTLLPAVLTVITMQLLVGGMHLDGLADTIDGLSALGSRKAGRDADRALEIMRKPDIGAMGVVGIGCVLLAQVAALATLPDARQLAVLAVLAPLIGRLAVLIASRRGVPPARPGGFGALFCEVVSPAEAAIHAAVVAVLVGAAGWFLGGPIVALGLIAALAVVLAGGMVWTRHLVRLFGGVTGDIFGALVEVTSTGLLVGAALLVSTVLR